MRMPPNRFGPPVALALSLAGGFGAGRDGAAPPALVAASPAGEVRLGDAPVTVAIPLTGEAAARIAKAASAALGRLRLAVDGVTLLHPGAIYHVYLDLPLGEAPDPQGPHFVGNLALFAEPGQTAEIRRTFDVTRQIRALRAQGGPTWPGSQLRLTFVRERHLGEPVGGTPGLPAGTEFLRFSRLSLLDGG